MKKIQIYALITLLFALGILFQWNYINDIPNCIHAWAQSDRYAIALGFVENQLNFFKPQTFIYNHEFPDNWLTARNSTITAVDFPIHDYIPAVFMKLTGITSPFMCRAYVLLYSLLGLFFLFRLAFLLTQEYYKSVFITVFAATSPVFVYYQGGFLPSIPSLANAIIGIYFYLTYQNENRVRYFNYSIAFLTLSALARTTFLIPLIAVFSVEFLRLFKKDYQVKNKIVAVLLSLLALVGYYFYNAHLRKCYGSEFLDYLITPNTWDDAKAILKAAYQNWWQNYFSRIHYIVLSLVLTLFLIFAVKKKFQFETLQTRAWFYLGVYSLGVVFFSIAMLGQFRNHDYYFLDSVFLPLLLALTLLLAYIPALKRKDMLGVILFLLGFPILVRAIFCQEGEAWREVVFGQYQNQAYYFSDSFLLTVLMFLVLGLWILKPISIPWVLLIALSFPMISRAVFMQHDRRWYDFRQKTMASIANFQGSKQFLDSLHIDPKAKILVLGVEAPNLHFIQMQRKGFVVMSLDKPTIEKSLTWNWDYVLIQNEYFIPDLYSPYPEITSGLKKIASNGKITICKREEKNTPKSLTQFLGLKTVVFQESINFDTLYNSHFENVLTSSKHYVSGKKAGLVLSASEYGLTYKSKNVSVLERKARTLLFSSYFRADTLNDGDVVVSIRSQDKNLYYQAFAIRDLLTKKGEWEKINLVFELPQITAKDYEFAIYVHNTGKNNLFYDDFTFSLY